MTTYDYLVLSQTIFYSALSFFIVVIGILLVSVIYYLIKIEGHVNKISENFEHASDEVKRNISEIIDKLQSLPLISLLFKKKKRR